MFLTDFVHNGKALAVNVTSKKQVWGGGSDLQICEDTTLTEGHSKPYKTVKVSYLVPSFWRCVDLTHATNSCKPGTYRGQMTDAWFEEFMKLACKYVEEVDEVEVQKVLDDICPDFYKSLDG